MTNKFSKSNIENIHRVDSAYLFSRKRGNSLFIIRLLINKYMMNYLCNMIRICTYNLNYNKKQIFQFTVSYISLKLLDSNKMKFKMENLTIKGLLKLFLLRN